MYFSFGKRDDAGNVAFYGMHGVYADVVVKTERGWRIKSRKWNLASTTGPIPGVPGPREFGSGW
jgi:hypothetical protein